MTVLAALRPSEWELPLFLHVLGAMLLVGTTVLVVAASLAGWRGESPYVARLAFRSLLFGVIPSWLLMRLSSEWIRVREGFDEPEPGWIGVGYLVADPGLLLLIAATVVAGLGARRARAGGGRGLIRAGGVLSSILLVAYVVAVWAMTTKAV